MVLVVWPSYAVSLVLFSFLLEGLETRSFIHHSLYTVVVFVHVYLVTASALGSLGMSFLIWDLPQLVLVAVCAAVYVFICVVMRLSALKSS
jgi:hypothetical protein